MAVSSPFRQRLLSRCPDESLVLRAHERKDLDAQAVLVSRHTVLAHRIAQREARHRPLLRRDPDEVNQVALIAILEAVHAYCRRELGRRTRKLFVDFLDVVVRRRVKNLLRSRVRYSRRFDDRVQVESLLECDSDEAVRAAKRRGEARAAVMERRDLLAAIDREAENLQPKLRRLWWWLRECRTLRSFAAEFHVSPKTISRWKRRIVRRLRRLYDSGQG
jgi:hypothetical protein